MVVLKSYLGTIKKFPKSLSMHLPNPGGIPWDPEDYVSFTEVQHDDLVHSDCFVIQAGAFEEDPAAATEAIEETVREWMDDLIGDF